MSSQRVHNMIDYSGHHDLGQQGSVFVSGSSWELYCGSLNDGYKEAVLSGSDSGVASVRRHQKPPPCRTEPVSTISKTDLWLAKAEPISDAACYLGEETDTHLSTTSFQTKQSQLPQLLLIRLLLQTLHQLRCPSLYALQHLNVSLVVGGPKLNTGFESLPTLQQINTPAQLGVISKLTEGALDPFVQIIDKDIKQNWPQHRALGNAACDRPPTGVNSIHHHSLGLAIQPVLYPAKSPPVQAMSSQFLRENAALISVKMSTISCTDINKLIKLLQHFLSELSKLGHYGLHGFTIRLVKKSLNDKAQMTVSSVKRGLLHESILEPVLFNTFINDLEKKIECTFIKFEHDTKS
ncbi:hypothetical protein QYF61_021671 [Mycteria americana]|uniref:Uncharacterized protein n=1 Tax=Mycteria americana TaxID=33587 RepID=A0AAN7NV95_MYCAM|nr:hypothetical protein QYF61_021671 [Mycteria americana]